MRYLKILPLLCSMILLPLIISAQPAANPYIIVLGIAQDGGFPQAGCKKDCCREAWTNPSARRMVSCIAVVDPVSRQSWVFDATPDFRMQLQMLESNTQSTLSGIFLTHGHIGHYTGLMQLGREVMGTNEMPVYAMPRMQQFLQSNGPWEQLVKLKNIRLQPLQEDTPIVLNERITVVPFTVPHRDEYTETVGYKIITKNKSAVFIPDIDKWEKWARNIDTLVQHSSYALLDATFFKNGEIKRAMTEVPHPFVEESMQRFEKLDAVHKKKIHFIHFNHTNPALQPAGAAQREILRKGFMLAAEGMLLPL